MLTSLSVEVTYTLALLCEASASYRTDGPSDRADSRHRIADLSHVLNNCISKILMIHYRNSSTSYIAGPTVLRDFRNTSHCGHGLMA